MPVTKKSKVEKSVSASESDSDELLKETPVKKTATKKTTVKKTTAKNKKPADPVKPKKGKKTVAKKEESESKSSSSNEDDLSEIDLSDSSNSEADSIPEANASDHGEVLTKKPRKKITGPIENLPILDIITFCYQKGTDDPNPELKAWAIDGRRRFT